MSMVMEMDIIQDEISRINADTAQGEQSIMVQSDMKAHGLKTGLWPSADYHDIMMHELETGLWPSADYRDIIDAHADARGWTQEGFTGMEIVQ
tara:strand:+ start:471 stop:749 length:279 start_codon:yes stop_codon:yes gene_type:complete